MTDVLDISETGLDPDSVPALSIRSISKSYYGSNGDVTPVLGGLSLDIADGEFVAILGFSGSGKTTLISALAGLIPVDSGEILVNGKPVVGTGVDRGVVFQSYSLMPWLTVEENVALAVNSIHSERSSAERQTLIDDTINLVGLSHATERKMAQLSGGMRQRVNLARALAGQPEILLMDEPLSALDALTRAKLQDEMERIRSQEKRTMLLVTNDVDEALLLADRVAILGRGPGAQIAKMFDINLERPRDRTQLSHDLNYTSLRAEIVKFLGAMTEDSPPDLVMDVSDEPKIEVGSLPDIEPEDLRPPQAYRDAAKARVESRYLELSKLTKVYPTPDGPLTVLDEIDLVLDKGDFVSLIGHSGCGKSTALTMAAGLNSITDGWIALDGHYIDAAGPDKAVVFQAPSLFPWLTARENVALGVERVYPKASKSDRREIVEYYLDRVGLGSAMDKKASELSNGMKQRVGLARAFALSPKLLLLDEPFGMLDSLTRWELQDVLVEVWNRSKVTTVCVTHDVDEAILLADRVIMMTNGPAAKIGKVLEIDLPRPRDRKTLLEDPRFYGYREEVLQFLAEYEHGAHGSQ